MNHWQWYIKSYCSFNHKSSSPPDILTSFTTKRHLCKNKKCWINTHNSKASYSKYSLSTLIPRWLTFYTTTHKISTLLNSIFSWSLYLVGLELKMMIRLEKWLDGLYYFVQSEPQSWSQPSTSYQVSITIVVNWHKQLGYLTKLSSKFLLKTIPHFVFNSDDTYQVCPLAKQTSLSLPISSI